MTQNLSALDASALFDGIAELNRKYCSRTAQATVVVPPITVMAMVAALGSFQEIVRYLNTRRSKNAILILENEADVQDAVFVMLRAWVTDLDRENPSDRIGNRYVIKDFVSRNARTVVETKYVRDKEHARSISKELNDDLEMYRHHAFCDNIIFFIYDPDSLIPDSHQLGLAIEGVRGYGEKHVTCYLVIRP